MPEITNKQNEGMDNYRKKWKETLHRLKADIGQVDTNEIT